MERLDLDEIVGLEPIYQHSEVLNYIRWKVETVRHIFTNTDILERRILNRLKVFYESGNKPSFYTAKKRIDFVVGGSLEKQTNDRSVTFSRLSVLNDLGELVEFDPLDVLADVEKTVVSAVYIKEEIARLAAGDFEAFTLNAWANGFNDSEISRTLAGRNGGKPESYRKAIQRFKARCQRQVASLR